MPTQKEINQIKDEEEAYRLIEEQDWTKKKKSAYRYYWRCENAQEKINRCPGKGTSNKSKKPKTNISYLDLTVDDLKKKQEEELSKLRHEKKQLLEEMDEMQSRLDEIEEALNSYEKKNEPITDPYESMVRDQLEYEKEQEEEEQEEEEEEPTWTKEQEKQYQQLKDLNKGPMKLNYDIYMDLQEKRKKYKEYRNKK